ncbi:MAG: box helicase [Herminiimonas sp.]|nr:box helicase [Herminiimonas sp.]
MAPTGETGTHLRALHLLCVLGWTYLTPTACMLKRGDTREVLLKTTLIEVLRTRRFEYKNQLHPLSPNAIDQIVRDLSAASLQDGLPVANQRLYEKLVLGVTVTEFMADGRKHHPTITIIDWRNQKENRFEVSDAFELLSEQGTHTRRMDVVCFVNGIPLAVIEAAPPGGGASTIADGISRQLSNQRMSGVPQLYAYAQLLFSVTPDDGLYGTTHTAGDYWSGWCEEEFDDAHFARVKKTPLSSEVQAALFAEKTFEARSGFQRAWSGQFAPTGHDRLLVSLLTPARLLEFIRFFVLFDRHKGKLVARCQQFFGVRAVIARIGRRRPNGAREGGLVSHSDGSGRSTMMMFLAKSLLSHDSLKDFRVLVVTERIELRDRMVNLLMPRHSFDAVSPIRKQRENAVSGQALARRVATGSERILFATIEKFNIAADLRGCHNPSNKLIVLMEDCQRRHIAETRRRVRKSLPRAAWFVFSGVPPPGCQELDEQPGPVIHAYPMHRDAAGKDDGFALRESVDRYNVSGVDGAVHPANFSPAGPQTAAGQEAGEHMEKIPSGAFRGSPPVSAWLGALRKALDGDQFPDPAGDQKHAALALLIDGAVRDAIAGNSLSRQDAESAIRKMLLPGLFAHIGLEKAREVIDQVLRITEAGSGRGEP